MGPGRKIRGKEGRKSREWIRNKNLGIKKYQFMQDSAAFSFDGVVLHI